MYDINLKGKTILVVDDNLTDLILMEQILEKADANVKCVENGEKALDYFNGKEGEYGGKNIDVVLMDIKMPRMDGFKTMENIRKINTEIPIIAYTAYPLTDVKKEENRVGMKFTDYILKADTGKGPIVIIYENILNQNNQK